MTLEERVARLKFVERMIYREVVGLLEDPIAYAASFPEKYQRNINGDLRYLREEVPPETFLAMAAIRRNMQTDWFAEFCYGKHKETAKAAAAIPKSELEEFVRYLETIDSMKDAGVVLRSLGHPLFRDYFDMIAEMWEIKGSSDDHFCREANESFKELYTRHVVQFLPWYHGLGKERKKDFWKLLPRLNANRYHLAPGPLTGQLNNFMKAEVHHPLQGFDFILYTSFWRLPRNQAQEFSQRPEISKRYYQVPQDYRNSWFILAKVTFASEKFLALDNATIKKIVPLLPYQENFVLRRHFEEGFKAAIEQGTVDEWADHIIEAQASNNDDYIGGANYREVIS